MDNKLLNKLNVKQLLIFVVILTIYFYLVFSNLIHYLVWTKLLMVNISYFLTGKQLFFLINANPTILMFMH